MNNDLISREDLMRNLQYIYSCDYIDSKSKEGIVSDIIDNIDNAPTVKVPETEVNCVLTMFGECSYNKTGCFDCEIKDKIRKALNNERPKGKWIKTNDYVTCAYGCIDYVRCSFCKNDSLEEGDYCPNCGADMRGGKQ